LGWKKKGREMVNGPRETHMIKKMNKGAALGGSIEPSRKKATRASGTSRARGQREQPIGRRRGGEIRQ